MAGEVGAFWEVLAEESVGVLVGASLPGAVRVAEVDLEAGVDAELSVLGHLGALVPGQRAPELVGQRGDGSGDFVTDCFGAVPGERRPVLGSGPLAVAFHGGAGAAAS